jgi:acetate kinase
MCIFICEVVALDWRSPIFISLAGTVAAHMSILVINAGSSSVKFGLFQSETLEPIARGLLDWAGSAQQATVTFRVAGGPETRQELDVPDYRSGVVAAMKMLREADTTGTDSPLKVQAIGHRLINGGEDIRRPVIIDEPMKKIIASYKQLAPLHIPAGLEAIDATEEAFPGVPQVGVFDSAFFGTIPPAAYLYPVPYEWYEKWGIRRFGYHGTSHAYCTERAAELLGRDASQLRLVICHLGQGGSATAVKYGEAVTNTMGYTPLEGFMMGTRSGTLDPGVLIHVLRDHGLTVDELDDILNRRSGLLGISGVSSDFRQVEAAAADGHERAKLALDIYAYRVRAMVGALAVTLGGVDAMVFTGGIGENSAWLRSEICRGLECLGVELDDGRNDSCKPDMDIAKDGAPARALVIHTREDYMIARAAKELSESGA